MPASKRVQFPPWINSRMLTTWRTESDIFHGMDAEVATEAAVKAGDLVKTACQDIIFTEPDLAEYGAVAESTRVWADQDNVYVGIPSGDDLKSRADYMNEEVYPVIETAFDMTKAEVVRSFEGELRLGAAFR